MTMLMLYIATERAQIPHTHLTWRIGNHREAGHIMDISPIAVNSQASENSVDE
jgi:hypothetical protein